MNILCDKPSELKEALGGNIKVEYSPPLDIYTSDNAFLRTLRGMYCSSKLDFTDDSVLSYIKDIAEPLDLPEPTCYTCYSYEDFDKFCRKYIDNLDDTIKIAYDVETTAAPYLSKRYKLAGFSLASSIEKGCYVILDSIDFHNLDTDLILDRLANVIKNHNMLVFNAQHEYIATKRCVKDVNLRKDSKHLDDAYSMTLLLKTEGFKPDLFKLKFLCNRLLGLENWATIIDDYIDTAMVIAKLDKIDFTKGIKELSEEQKEYVASFRNILKPYGYSNPEILQFISILQDSYNEWKEQDTIPYSLIPSKMISKYGCYDSCYLLALFDYYEDWAKELTAKLDDSLNKPDIKTAYEETIDGQIMSAILTLNGVFISEERDNEVKEKSKTLSEKYYDKLWEINSDTTGKNILKEYVKKKFEGILCKKYVLPNKLLDLIPEGFKFIKTTPSLYSFECEILDIDKITTEIVENSNGVETKVMYLTDDKSVKVYTNKEGKYCCKLLQKHLLSYDTLKDKNSVIEDVLDSFLEDSIKQDGTLSKTVFKPMSGPSELYDILNQDLMYAKFLDRVVLYEYNNLPEKLKDKNVVEFLDNNLLSNFDDNMNQYLAVSKVVKSTVLNYIKKQYSYKNIYENLISEGLKSFASNIIAYIYTIFTVTGCSVENPKYSAFDFICQLKICRRYLRMISTFINGASGGYSSQMKIAKNSVNKEFLELVDTKVTDDEGNPIYTEDTNNVVFGKWYANVADTGRWTATIHNVPAGAYCKRRFVSRFPGGIIMTNDMSQAEVRELAAVSKCSKLLETVSDPTIDIHRRTASLAFDILYDEVTSTQRKQTKEGIFSIVYGRELESLAQSLFKGDKAAAQRLMDAIFKVFPEVPIYLKNALEDAKKHGYLVTRRGAPIFINPFAEGGTSKGEQAFKRNVQNYAIQGGASYWCTNTLVNVQKLIDKYNMNEKIKIISYIHDSIEIDVSPDVIDIAYKIMHTAFNKMATQLYKVPTSSDTVIGVSMGEELGFERIEKNHYVVEGNNQDIIDLIEQLKQTYNIDCIKSEIGETKNNSDNIDWIFVPRSEARWYDSITPAKYEIVLTNK